MDTNLQLKLLKVLEDKRVYFQSPYFDPNDSSVPLYIKKLFAEGAPADFILVGATTREPTEINPALRSRCAEVFFEPLDGNHIESIVQKTAERIQVKMDPHVPGIISRCTQEGRKAMGIFADAFAHASLRLDATSGDRNLTIEARDVHEVLRLNRMPPLVTQDVNNACRVGRVFGLGVSGFIGRLLELEAVAFPARISGQGQLRFNESAGQMTKDSIFNAVTNLRRYGKIDVRDYDVHINFIGGGLVDGPSAGVALCLAIWSAISGIGIPQDIAFTGELSLQGDIKPVGGIVEKVYGAKQAGIREVYIPKDNQCEAPTHAGAVDVRGAAHIRELFSMLDAGVGSAEATGSE